MLSGALASACAHTSQSVKTPMHEPVAGPLAGLNSNSSSFVSEVWTGESGDIPLLYYARENVRLSAQCRPASGQFSCEAMRFMLQGPPVEIARRELDGRTSAGVKVCLRIHQPIVTAHSGAGNEDSFCRFPDGSLVSNGALEQYKMQVVP